MSSEGLKRYLEVKGRSAADCNVSISLNVMNTLAQLGDSAWLYIVINFKSKLELFRIKNPAKNLKLELKSNGVQYFLLVSEWKSILNH